MDTISELWIWQLLGRMHPLMVHFPIGLLVVAFFLELLTFGGKRGELRAGIRWLVYIGAGTALITMLLGLMLAYDGNYETPTISYHQWGGIATTILALIAAWFLYRADNNGGKKDLKFYRGSLGATILVLTFAGHMGASLTHGSDYITSVLPWNYDAPSPGEFRELLAEVEQHKQMGTVAEEHKRQLNVGVRRVFANSCYRCHDDDEAEGGLVLNSKEGVMAGGDEGPIIDPGNPGDSELIRRLELPKGHDDVMPQKGSALSAEEVELIRTWIDLGAHWSDEDVKVFPEAELALSKPEPPQATSGFSNPVDRFTDAYFKEHDIDWPEPVDDVVFMRRVYMDVVGLLPEPEEVQAFAADNSPDKRARLIDSLLDRKHAYSQHWLSFWNDLLRNDYSGTGYITGGRKQITDWLYEALYDNKPYDQMVRELVNPDEESEGFIRGIEWRGNVNASQTTEMQAAQNISQSLLGVNLKCASCHDSFVSNLTLDDAYSFAAIFADSALAMERCDVPTGDTAQASFLYRELGEIDEDKPKEERLKQLANFIADKENGRLYRTIANRFWERLMGRGLVEPTDEMDNEPWSQEMLDWLAADLIDHNYDLKYLLASILRSRTYQLPAVAVSEDEKGATDDYVFKGPMIQRLTAEEFADAVARVAAPLYYSVDYYPYEGQNAEANWIWYNSRANDRASLPPPGKYYFRHDFEVPAGRKIREAKLLISVDEAFQLYLNGSRIGGGEDWREVERINVRQQLKSGKNLLALEGENGGTVENPAGILLNLRITFADGGRLEVRSNEQWKATDRQPSPEWMALDFDASAWGSVRSFGDSKQSKHWNRLVNFTHETDNQLAFTRASLVENDALLKAMGRPPRENVNTTRDSEATMLQALELTNGEILNEVLARGAERWINDYGDEPDKMIEELYLTAFSRRPSQEEARIAGDKLSPEPGKEAVQDLLWSIIMQPEFQLIY